MLEVNRNVLPAEVERAAAAVKALQAQLAEAESGYRSQEVERARLAAEAARVTLDNARKDKEPLRRALSQGGGGRESRATPSASSSKPLLKEHQRAVEAYQMAREGFRREEIDSARSRLAEGQAALRLAQSNLKKIEASEQDVEAARAQVAAAKAALDVAEIQLDHTELRAPYAGIILSRNVEPGEVVSPNQEVLSIADLSTRGPEGVRGRNRDRPDRARPAGRGEDRHLPGQGLLPAGWPTSRPRPSSHPRSSRPTRSG
ncbi:MAG: HlyD family efflux transporter periplasmic adaptor subunit [Comamonadaceae bacterium]|nr:HlyD family efflux transporter periplasmic adaptor subunit [Comamonadaceae bacterium]